MPLYRVLTPEGLLDERARHDYSGDVTRIHCAVTGAPPEFVHVVYREDTAAELPEGRSGLVFGSIRSGRTDEQKADLTAQPQRALAGRGSVDRESVEVLTVDVPASWVMEGGRILPEPGDEDDWSAAGQS